MKLGTTDRSTDPGTLATSSQAGKVAVRFVCSNVGQLDSVRKLEDDATLG